MHNNLLFICVKKIIKIDIRKTANKFIAGKDSKLRKK